MQRRAFLQSAGLGIGGALVSSLSHGEGRVAATSDQQITEPIYVSAVSGHDASTGTKSAPLRSLAEAGRRINRSTGTGPADIVLTEGVYAVGETAVFKPERRTFSKANRLTIRAEVLPNDSGWHWGRMPTLIHTLPTKPTWNGANDQLHGASDGMSIGTSHVSILGLRILGMPVVESPEVGQIKRLYGINRFDRSLEDLEIGHCVFAGDIVTNPFHVGIIANGDSVNVHHCIFRGMKISVVYWSGNSKGHSMTHCICDDLYGSAVWTSSIDDDFVFTNNLVTRCNYAWTWQPGLTAAADANRGTPPTPEQLQAFFKAMASAKNENHYKVVDSLFAGSRRVAGTGTGARLEYRDIDSSFLQMIRTPVTSEGVQYNSDQTHRNYLHPVEGSDAAGVGAGLFSI
jgi:hypothetical protein